MLDPRRWAGRENRVAGLVVLAGREPVAQALHEYFDMAAESMRNRF